MKRLLSWMRTPFFRVTSFMLGAVFAAGLVTMFAAQAVDEYGVFELDGNVEGNGPGLPDDWQEVYNGTSSAAKYLFIPVSDGMGGGEGPDYDRSHLTQGTKDTQDLLDWVIDPGDVANAKSEILNAFAAAYLVPVNGDTHFVTYFGFDREANEGTANGSFWLLRQPTEIVQIAGQDTPDNPDDDQFSFNRSHSDGDILLATDYVQGGKQPITFAFMWQGGADGQLVEIGGESATCPNDGSVHAEPYCAITNTGGEMVPWPFPGKNLSAEGYYDELMLLEGGVDLTELLGEDVGCFATFIAGTRTSAPPKAALKDIAVGEFDTCSIDVTKTGDELAKVGADPADSAQYTIVVKNDGLVTMYKQSISDSLMGDLTDGSNSHIQSSDCGAALAAGASCTIVLDYPIPAGTPAGALTNKVSVVYDHRSTLDGDERSAESEWDVLVFQPSVDLTKSADVMLAMAGDTVNYTVTLTNTSSAGTPALLLQSLTDSLAGDLTNAANYTSSTCTGSLALSGSCQVVYPYTIPAATGADAVIHNLAEVHYTPGDQFTNDIWDNDSYDVVIFSPALEIVKECPVVYNPDGSVDVWTAGETRNFTFTLTNLSDADAPALTLKTLTDALLGGDISGYLPAGALELSHGESHSFSIPYTATDADADAGGVTNSVNAVYTLSYNGKVVEVSDDDSVTCPVVPPAPARLILQKELIGGQDREFRFLVSGPDGVVAAEALTPVAPSPAYVESGEITLSTLFGTSTTYTAEELLDAANLPVDTEFVSLSCTENDVAIPGSISGAVATLAADEDDVFVCRWVNQMKARILLSKVTDTLTPIEQQPAFDFTGVFGTVALMDGESSGPLLVSPNADYTATEVNIPGGWDLVDIQCVEDRDQDSGGSGATATYNTEPGEQVSCTFYNRERGMVDVIKTVAGVLNSGMSFDFQIRTGASAGSLGTVVASGSSDPTSGLASFSCQAGVSEAICRDVLGMAKLVPGDYQFCEVGMMPGWMNTEVDEFGNPVDPQRWFVPGGGDPDVDNSDECIAFTLAAGESATFRVDNQAPQGDARTIGYWKNWTSCDGHGNQDPVLDETLAAAGGVLYLGNFGVDNCEDAVSLLDKRDVKNGRKRAGDPAYGLAAQLLAAKLNVEAGAYTCQALFDTIANADALLSGIDFDGTGDELKRDKTGAGAEANGYAGMLDAYNNNMFCY